MLIKYQWALDFRKVPYRQVTKISSFKEVLNKLITYNRLRSGLCSQLLGGNLWALGMSCLIGGYLYVWGPRQPRQSMLTMNYSVVLGHAIETKVSHVGGQSCLCEQAQIKTSGNQGLVIFLVGRISDCHPSLPVVSPVHLTPLGETNWKLMSGTFLDLSYCDSFLAWFESLSFCYNKQHLRA